VILSVVSTSDTHGHIERAPIFGGYVDILRRLRKEDGGVVLVDAGDMFQGTIAANETEGAACIRAFNALGYHGVAIGNHEFDYGPVGPALIASSASDDPRGALQAAIKLAKFPILASNLVEKASGERVSWPGVDPSVMTEIAGVKVGIIGAGSEALLRSTVSANVQDLRMAPLADTLRSEAQKLREQGAVVVIATVHGGGGCKAFEDPDDLSSCQDSEIFEVARDLEPNLIDVLVAGHTHQAIAHRVNGTAIVQSYAYAKAFGRVDLHVNPSTGDVVVLKIHPPHPLCQNESKDYSAACEPGTYEGEPVLPSAVVQQAIAEDMARSEARRLEPVGVTIEADLMDRGRPASPLSSQLAAWMLEAHPGADVSFVNSGGIRASIPAGPLHYGAFYEMFPFDNRFATATIKALSFRKLLQDGLVHGHGFAIAGIQANVTCKGEELQVELTKKGRVLRDNDDIVLLTSDYLAMSERFAQAGMEKEAFHVDMGVPIREAIVAYLRKKGGTVAASPSIPVKTPGSWPVTCLVR
jgi:5'-nucleotidase